MDKITPQALLIAGSGITIVFVVLAVICLMIPIVSRLVRAFTEIPAAETQTEKKTETEPTQPQQPIQPAPAATTPAAYGGNIMLIDVDEKTAVCVMAIVSHETGIPLSELIFKKIKAL